MSAEHPWHAALIARMPACRRAAARAAAVIALALPFSACSTTHAYEGPARSKAEVATITAAYPSSGGAFFRTIGDRLTLSGTWYTNVLAVDDNEEISDWTASEVEVLPGRHTVTTHVKLQAGGGMQSYGTYIASFDAVAGGEYEMHGRGPSLDQPAGFDVWDVKADVAVASSDATAAQCVTARLEWDGRTWTQADWLRTAELTTTSYVPPGDVLSSWREIVELQFVRARKPLDLDEVMRLKLKDLERAADNAFQVPVESAADLRVFTWSAVASDGGGVEQGVTCLRNGPGGCHILIYAVRGVLAPQAATTWAARFKAAELVPTES